MSERATTRRSFLKTAGAAAVTGLVAGPRTTWSAGRSNGARQDTGPIASSQPTATGDLLSANEAVFRPTSTGCTVQWVPNGTVEARVLAASNPDQLVPVHQLASPNPTEVVVGGFQADSDLYLQCQFRRPPDREWIVRPVRRVHTARSPGQAFHVVLIADSHVVEHHRDGWLRNLGRTSAMVLGDRPDFMIFLGDEPCPKRTGDQTGDVSQERAFTRWREWREAWAPVLATVPSFLTLGNHEGECGYHQVFWRYSDTTYLQRWATIARKRYCLNPLSDTYPEGGENEGWIGEGADQGNRSPLQNYFAWTWGDALFVVLDVGRYTNVRGKAPAKVKEWTLGPAQLQWLEQVLTTSRARWKFVAGHHLVGGYAWNSSGVRHGQHVYGRGGGRYARVGEQARITDIMKRAGAKFFLYGHDHVFAHQQAEGIHFVCTARPTLLNPKWWSAPGWKEAYGDAAARNPHDFYGAIGYTRLTISPQRVQFEFIRAGTDPRGVENVSQQEGEVIHAFSVT